MNKFKMLRLTRGLSQKQLADFLGIHEVTLCRIERGWYSRPPTGLEDKLRQFFGPEWTFARLMEPVKDLASSGSDAA
jgi:DNA-binding XRE family transcriptional regulator